MFGDVIERLKAIEVEIDEWKLCDRVPYTPCMVYGVDTLREGEPNGILRYEVSEAESDLRRSLLDLARKLEKLQERYALERKRI